MKCELTQYVKITWINHQKLIAINLPATNLLLLCQMVIVVLGMFIHPAQGASVSVGQIRSEQELELLREKINTLQTQLRSSRKQEQSLVTELDVIERKFVKLAARQRDQLTNLKTSKIRQSRLNQKLVDLQIADSEALDKLVRLVRLSFMLGQQDSVMLVLNQKDPSKIARTMALYRYIVESKNARIEAIRAQKSEIIEVSNGIEAQQRIVDQAIAELDKSEAEFRKTAQSRQVQLIRVQGKLSGDASQIEIYQKRQSELEMLLANLQRQDHLLEQHEPKMNEQDEGIQGQSKYQLSEDGFRQNKGRLLMPANAEIGNRFGQVKPESGLVWEGLMFKVVEGQKVSAIYPGQVVFSDWFRGYGQLLVLDHGEGYMSLYGHNQQLHVELGSSVDAGQLIAYAGSTGGLPGPGLYFEIRYNGTPDDPLKWCRL